VRRRGRRDQEVGVSVSPIGAGPRPARAPGGPRGLADLLRGQTVHGLDLGDPARAVEALRAIQRRDPAWLRQVLVDIGERVRRVAGAGASALEAEFLCALAEKFDEAAVAGDLRPLLPPGA
jgi:hypothetical protein